MIQFLLKGFGVSNQTIACVTVTFPQALSLALNPVVAHYSDRCRSRWGRRLPFILLTVPVLTLAMAAMGFTPMIARHLHRDLGTHSPGEQTCALISFIIVFILFDLAAIVQGNTWGGLINDVLPQKVLGRFMGDARLHHCLPQIQGAGRTRSLCGPR
jgi:maltose/moltooligosaccharide transporter